MRKYTTRKFSKFLYIAEKHMNTRQISDSTNGESAVPKIGVVGHSRAGKSTFLAVLKHAFEAAEWAADIDDTREARRGGGTQQEPLRYYKYLKNFIEKGFFPPPTPVQVNVDSVTFNVSRRNGNQFLLEFFDPAGEILEGSHDAGTKAQIALQGIQNSLRECTGVLLLLDPEIHPDKWLETWINVEAGLALRRSVRVAVCFAKADSSVRQRRFRVRDAREWVEELPGAANFLTNIRNRAHIESKYFFVSAAGWVNGVPNIRTFVNSRVIRRVNVNSGAIQHGNTLRELLPDPAQLLSVPNGNGDQFGFRYMQNLPVFSDPLRIVGHDFQNNPITQNGPLNTIPKDQQGDAMKFKLAGIHVGFGRGSDNNESRIRPWNIVEPVLWLAGFGEGRR